MNVLDCCRDTIMYEKLVKYLKPEDILSAETKAS